VYSNRISLFYHSYEFH